MEENKEVIEDITEKVVAEAAAEGKVLLDAKSALDTSAKTIRNDAKDADRNFKQKGGPRRDREKREEPSDGLSSKLICINRITKVVKGGRTLRFNSVVVVGDKNGRVAIGSGKAREVTEAIRKAEMDAKKNFQTVPLVGTTVPHEVIGKFGTSKVKIMPAKEGHGIIAGGSARAVLELAGYKDVTAKCYGSTNKTNVVKATMKAIQQLRTREQIMALRGKPA